MSGLQVFFLPLFPRSFYPFSPDAGKLGDTGGLNAAYTLVLIPVCFWTRVTEACTGARGPTAEEALDQMTTLSAQPTAP